jgi:hypothetical protein
MSAALAHPRKSYMDLPHWRNIARAHGLKLPQSNMKGWPVRKLMNRYGVSQDEFREVFACTPREWRRKNPTWCLLGFAGQLIEIVHERVAEAALAE